LIEIINTKGMKYFTLEGKQIDPGQGVLNMATKMAWMLDSSTDEEKASCLLGGLWREPAVNKVLNAHGFPDEELRIITPAEGVAFGWWDGKRL
jgi:hypothetical protein